jgi:DNA polymerase-3 subunit delta'
MYAVLPTIISRCQLIRFNSLAPRIIRDILLEEAGIPEEKASLLSELAGGSVSQALKIWESWSEDNQWRSPERILEVLKRQDRLALLALSAQMEKDQYLQPTLEFLMRWFRDVLVWEKTSCVKLVSNQKMVGEHWPAPQRSEKAVALISEALKRLKQNANPRLTLDVLFLKLHDLLGYSESINFTAHKDN